MTSIQSHKDLVVWQKGIEIANLVYTTTKSFPKEELFGLCSQMRRSSVSIPSNIAEGFSRRSQKEFTHFLRIAHGSLTELDTQVLIAQTQGFLTQEQCIQLNTLLVEETRMLNAFIKKVRS